MTTTNTALNELLKRIPSFPRYTHIQGPDRHQLRHHLAAAYRAGASLDVLAQHTGRSCAFVRRLLHEQVVPLRRHHLHPEPSWLTAIPELHLPQPDGRHPTPQEQLRLRIRVGLATEYEQGASVHSLARTSGLAYSTVRGLLIQAGVTFRRAGVNVAAFSYGQSPEQRDHLRNRVVALYATGIPVAAVGEELGLSTYAARKLLLEAKVPLRGPSGGTLKNYEKWTAQT